MCGLVLGQNLPFPNGHNVILRYLSYQAFLDGGQLVSIQNRQAASTCFEGANPTNLDIHETPPLGKTRFTEFLVRQNALDEGGFGEWILYPGMLFDAQDKWWGDGGKRQQPHEGLDLCLYGDQQGEIHLLDKGTKIPVMYDGVVARIVNDFLGKSIIVDHGGPNGRDSRFFTIYGHTNPHADLQVGKSLLQGDVIATIADSSKTEAALVPHLHISLGLMPKAIPYDNLDWQTISTTSMVTLLDPLSAMDCRYVVVEGTSTLR